MTLQVSLKLYTTPIDKKYQDNIWTTKMCPAMQYSDVIANPRSRTAAILKIAKSPYLSEKASDFDKIWYTKADIEPDDNHVTKIEIFKIQDGGGRHLENRFLVITHQPIARFQRHFV